MRRRLRFALALSAVLLTSGCDESGNSSGSSSASVASGASSSSSGGTSSSSSGGTGGSSSSGSSGSSSSGSAGILDATWNAPTTNTDGSALTDLAFYRAYYSTASTPCPGPSFFQIESPTRHPQGKEVVTFRLTGLLATVRYFVAVTAVDSEGVESACSSVASAPARSIGSAAGLLVGLPANANASASEVTPFAAGQLSSLTSLTADLGPQMPGATATFIASATGGTAPYQFKWWLWDGATWTVLQEWSTGNIYSWVPSTANSSYAVGVWVRSGGNTADQPDGYPASSAGYRSIAFAIN